MPPVRNVQECCFGTPLVSQQAIPDFNQEEGYDPPLSVLNCNPKLLFVVQQPFMVASPIQHCHVISTPIYNTHILPCNHCYQYMEVCTFQGGYKT